MIMAKLDYSNKSLYKNAIISALWKILAMVISFVSVPLLLRCVGVEKYGIWVTLLSVVSWIYYLDLGIGGGLRNKLAESLACDDFSRAREYLNASYLLLGAICLLFVLGTGFLLLSADIGNLICYESIDENLNLVLFLALFFACVNFVMSLVNNIWYAEQQASLVGFFNLIGQAFWAIGIVLCLWLNASMLWIVAIVEGMAQLLKNILASLAAFAKYPVLRFTFGRIDRFCANGILLLGGQLFFMQIAALILNGTDNLIIMRYFGADDVTAYSLCYKYFGIIQAFFVVLITPLYSAYTVAYTKRDILWIKQTLRKSICFYGLFLLFICIAGLLCPYFMKFWTQTDIYIPPNLIFLIAVYFVLLMFSHNFSTLVNGVGRVTETTIAVGVEAVLNVPLSIFLAVYCDMGVDGVILGSIGVMCISVIIYPYVTWKIIKEMEK